MKKTKLPNQNFSFFSWMLHSAISAGTVVFVLTALMNTVTWYLEKFFNVPKFWTFAWNKFLDYFGEDEFDVYFYGTTIIPLVVFWVFGLFYTVLDITTWPGWISKYKIQPGTNQPVSRKRLTEAILQVLFNQIVIGIPFTYVACLALKWRGVEPLRSLPSLQWNLIQVAICVLAEEIGFYYSHRLLHHGSIYKYIHKQHHEWTSPISITAVYCHPIEHVFSNLVPPLIGPLVMGSHITTMWLWFGVAITNTLNAHSGYHFPFFLSPQFHDFHHLKFNQCFGVIGILDYLHGTDQLFRSSAAFRRHVTTFSLKPLSEQYPDYLTKPE